MKVCGLELMKWWKKVDELMKKWRCVVDELMKFWKSWWIDEKVKLCGWWIDEVLEKLMNWWKSEIVWDDELMNLRKKMMKSAYLKPRTGMIAIGSIQKVLI